MRLTVLFTLLFSAFAAATPVAEPEPQATGEAAPNPNDVTIDSVTWNGSGCKMGSNADTNYALSSDRKTITILYSNYVAQAGVGVRPADGRRNCLLNFRLKVPRGWQFTVSQTTFHGFADMGGKCTGYVKASYWFSGQTGTVSAQHSFPKNALGNYETTTKVVAAWPTCNVPTLFNINSEAFISCPAPAQGQLTVDSIDHTYKETYRLLWKRC